jgi:hypothetical protein
MNLLEVDIEKYEIITDPTNLNHQITDWTIYENDLKNIREMRKNAIQLKKRKKSEIKSLDQESENNLLSNNTILKPSKISKLSNIDNILK